MFLANTWEDYEVLDTGDGEKLERWGNVILRRPDPQTIWPKADPALWKQAQAHYHRSEKWEKSNHQSRKRAESYYSRKTKMQQGTIWQLFLYP